APVISFPCARTPSPGSACLPSCASIWGGGRTCSERMPSCRCFHQRGTDAHLSADAISCPSDAGDGGRHLILDPWPTSMQTMEYGMKVSEAVLTRRSMRVFKAHTVPRETVEWIIATASRAASNGNLQPWKLYVT